VTSPSAPGSSEPSPPGVYRPSGVRVLAVTWWVLAVVLGGDLLLRGSAGAALVGVALLALSCAVVHAMFWYPAVLVDDDGVDLVNVARRVRLPWSAVEAIDTRWALSLDAAGRRWTSWAAPASGRRLRPVTRRETPWAEPGAEGIAGSRAPGSSAGEAAVLVGTRWQTWRDRHGAGTVEVRAPQVSWNAPVLASVGGTALLAALTLSGVLLV
jgi:hypothetical protein